MNSVEICNLSLMMLGMPTITSFDDNNQNAKMCKNFFPVVRDRALRDHNWSFATAYFTLQASTETSPEPDYPCVCPQPVDLIRVIEMEHGEPFLHVKNNILTRYAPIQVKYIRRVSETEDFDSLFAEAIQYLLASEIIMTNTRDAGLIQLYRSEYERRLAVARSVDSSENRFAIQPSPRRSRWIEAHMGAEGCGPRSCKITWTQGNAGIQQ